MDDIRLLFLISQPRSGSTLLQRILAGDPDLYTHAEPWLMLHPVYALRPGGHTAEYNAQLAHAAMSDFLAALPDGQAEYEQALRRMALSLYGSACKKNNARIFLDKTPRYYFIIPELARIFPQAQFIILFRNPLAVLSSMIETWVKGNWLLLGDYFHDLVTAPQRLLEGIALLGDRAIVVHYENLVQSPDEEIKRVCNSTGLDFTPDLLTYSLPPRTPGQFGDPTGIYQANRPESNRLEKWLLLGKASQTRYLARKYLQTLGPSLVEKMGYSYDATLTTLDSVTVQHKHFVIPWSLIFKERKSPVDKLILVLLSSLQQGRLVYSSHQLREFVRQYSKHS